MMPMTKKQADSFVEGLAAMVRRFIAKHAAETERALSARDQHLVALEARIAALEQQQRTAPRLAA